MSFCQKCGAELAEGAAFCASCGTAAGTAGTGRKQEYTGVVKKCPQCGEVIPNGLVTKCPSCGFELNKTEVAKGIKEFIDALKKAEYDSDRNKVIENYVVPNNKEDVIEFLTFALESAKRSLDKKVEETKKSITNNIIFRLVAAALSWGLSEVYFAFKGKIDHTTYTIWTNKIKSTISKEQLMFANDSNFLNTLNLIQKQAEEIENKGKTEFKKITTFNLIIRIVVLALLIFGIVKFYSWLFRYDDNNIEAEIKRLESMVKEINEDISNRNYDEALEKASAVRWTFDDKKKDVEKWDKQREHLIKNIKDAKGEEE